MQSTHLKCKHIVTKSNKIFVQDLSMLSSSKKTARRIELLAAYEHTHDMVNWDVI